MQAQARLADVLEVRGADPQQAAMRRAFLSDVAFPPDARVVEVKSGRVVKTVSAGPGDRSEVPAMVGRLADQVKAAVGG